MNIPMALGFYSEYDNNLKDCAKWIHASYPDASLYVIMQEIIKFLHSYAGFDGELIDTNMSTIMSNLEEY